MEQNLKELLEKDRLINHKRKKNHEDIFVKRLHDELPLKRQKSFTLLQIAASILVLVSIGITSYLFVSPQEKTQHNHFVLSNISPDLEKIEHFYVANIKFTLSEIQNNGYNQFLFDRYMKRVSILKKEYNFLSIEMNEEGPNSMSISALISNLKKQLDLLQELKTELETLKINKREIL